MVMMPFLSLSSLFAFVGMKSQLHYRALVLLVVTQALSFRVDDVAGLKA